MKKVVALVVLLVLICSLSVAVVACKDKGADKDALIGKWMDSDGNYYQFNKDGTGKQVYDTSNTRTFKWGLVKGSYLEGTADNDWTYYIDFDNGGRAAIKNIETDSSGKQFIDMGKPYYHV